MRGSSCLNAVEVKCSMQSQRNASKVGVSRGAALSSPAVPRRISSRWRRLSNSLVPGALLCAHAGRGRRGSTRGERSQSWKMSALWLRFRRSSLRAASVQIKKLPCRNLRLPLSTHRLLGTARVPPTIATAALSPLRLEPATAGAQNSNGGRSRGLCGRCYAPHRTSWLGRRQW